MSRKTMYKNLTGERPAGPRPERGAVGPRRRALAALAALPLWPARTRAQSREPLKVGFVYVSPVGQAGWSYQHDLGRLAMAQALGDRVRTSVVEAVPEGADAERVLRELAAQGHGLLFATSFGYLEPALRVARDFPQVKFEHAGGYKTAANLNTYNARYYEGRYLAGMLAALASRSGVAGYVAGFPVPEVVQGINAFTLGMRAVAPHSQVRVVWLNTWFDPLRERDAALALIGQGADVLTNHSGSPAVPLAAEEQGIKLIAYQSDMVRFAPTAQLAAVTHHWGNCYTQAAQAVLDGTWQARPRWGGMREGWVRLSALAPGLPATTRERLAARQSDIVAGRFRPFSGRLEDNRGRVRLAEGMLPEAAIAAMDWFVQGVVGSVPGAWAADSAPGR
jgi:basic membrane protein A